MKEQYIKDKGSQTEETIEYLDRKNKEIQKKLKDLKKELEYKSEIVKEYEIDRISLKGD